jgi:ubiquitin-conjugating enzyme E2 A
MAAQRLQRDLLKLQRDSQEMYSASPEEDDIMKWTGLVVGPTDTPWEGGIFKLSLEFPQDYPTSPPKVKFLSPVFHPNVYQDGSICLDTLKANWSPALDVTALLISIQSLLADPNPASPANAVAAEMMRKDLAAYEAKVRECVEKTLEDEDE